MLFTLWVSWGGTEQHVHKRFSDLIQEICKSCANYSCLFLFSPPCSSLKLVFWGNHSQMGNIRLNRFHLPALLLSLRGDMLSPSDIFSQWTITEHSSITLAKNFDISNLVEIFSVYILEKSTVICLSERLACILISGCEIFYQNSQVHFKSTFLIYVNANWKC